MSSAHVVDDLYQGAVPAILPFLVLERGYSYTAIAGLTLAATVLSSVAQPAFGWWTDRHPRPWLVAAGIGLAGGGIALAGIVTTYVATWIVIALLGLGIAAPLTMPRCQSVFAPTLPARRRYVMAGETE